ncbi:MAG: glycoside hydrolase family 9 protein [Promethearchaeota archaeon]
MVKGSPRKWIKLMMSLITVIIMVISSIIIGVKISIGAGTGENLVLVNQLGYLPTMEKIFIFKLGNALDVERLSFDLVNTRTGARVLQDQPLRDEGNLWNDFYASGNFSGVVTPGRYEIRVHDDRNHEWISLPFTIGDDCYKDVLKRAVQFYYYQRCGTEVQEIIPGYVGHHACHVDDGYWVDEAGNCHHKNLTGGWHDAGDYGKYTESPWNTQFTVYSLSFAYECQKDYFDSLDENLYDTSAPDVVDEAVWGARFLQKIIVEDLEGNGRVLCGVFGRRRGDYNRFGFWGPPSAETDNMPNTDDDRMVGSLWNVSGTEYNRNHEYGFSYVNAQPAMMVAAALAKTAWIMKDFDLWNNDSEVNPGHLVEMATRIHNSHIASVLNVTQGNFTLKLGISAHSTWPTLAALTELARWANHTGNTTKWNLYNDEANAIRTGIIEELKTLHDTNPIWVDLNGAYLSVYFHDLIINGSTGADFNETIASYINETLKAACFTDGNLFRYIKPKDGYFNYWGLNWHISLASGILAIAGSTLQDKESIDLASDNVAHWIMGRNPFGICMIESLGSKNLPIYHHRYASIPGNDRGAIPGSVPNGIANRNENEDLPYLDLREPIPERIEQGEFRSNEPYITDNANFILGFSLLLTNF